MQLTEEENLPERIIPLRKYFTAGFLVLFQEQDIPEKMGLRSFVATRELLLCGMPF